MTNAIPIRPLGRTGFDVPILGFGTGEGGMGLKNRRAINLYRFAADRGISFFDTAPGYENAQRQFAKVLGKSRARSSIILASKAATANGRELTKTFESNLRTLKTDYLDIAYIHSVGSFDADEILDPGGALEAIVDLKQRGLARFIGFTSHNRADRCERILKSTGSIDVVMLAMNPIETHTYGFEKTVLPVAKERGVGVVAMKVYGGAPEMVYKKPVPSALEARERGDHELALRYALSLPGVSSAVIGMYHERELVKNLEYTMRFRPLSNDEKIDLLEWGRVAAPGWGERYGPVE